jgi:tRNA(adenine34) deaminase
MSEQYLEFMLEAYKEAEKAADRGDYGIGAVLVLNNRIVSRAGNQVISRGIDPNAHAEIITIDDIKGTIFDNIEKYREMIMITTVSPCPMCWGRLLVAGLKEVVYGAYDHYSSPNYEENIPEIFIPTKPKIIELGGDLAAKCNELFLATREEIDKKFFRV